VATDTIPDVDLCERCRHPVHRHTWPVGCDLCTCPCPVNTHAEGGYTGGGPVPAWVHPEECLVKPTDDGWVCIRPDHNHPDEKTRRLSSSAGLTKTAGPVEPGWMHRTCQTCGYDWAEDPIS
jgi:hypothetical protein